MGRGLDDPIPSQIEHRELFDVFVKVGSSSPRNESEFSIRLCDLLRGADESSALLANVPTEPDKCWALYRRARAAFAAYRTKRETLRKKGKLALQGVAGGPRIRMLHDDEHGELNAWLDEPLLG